jgi:hypothetical protein
MGHYGAVPAAGNVSDALTFLQPDIDEFTELSFGYV